MHPAFPKYERDMSDIGGQGRDFTTTRVPSSTRVKPWDRRIKDKRPTLRRILANTSPSPWTLAAFMAHLANNHCLETLEFTMDAGRYRKHYAKMLSKAKEGEAPPLRDREYVKLLWARVIDAYIRPDSSREVDLPSEVRDPILGLEIGANPPPPETLDPAVARIYELMDESLLKPFLEQQQRLMARAEVHQAKRQDHVHPSILTAGKIERAQTRLFEKQLERRPSLSDLSSSESYIHVNRSDAILKTPVDQPEEIRSEGDGTTIISPSSVPRKNSHQSPSSMFRHMTGIVLTPSGRLPTHSSEIDSDSNECAVVPSARGVTGSGQSPEHAVRTSHRWDRSKETSHSNLHSDPHSGFQNIPIECRDAERIKKDRQPAASSIVVSDAMPAVPSPTPAHLHSMISIEEKILLPTLPQNVWDHSWNDMFIQRPQGNTNSSLSDPWHCSQSVTKLAGSDEPLFY
jgi:hypothetical protein